MDFPESDWKIFRTVREPALERFQERILEEIARTARDTTRSARDRYHAVYELVHDRNREVAYAFDAPRRSQALLQLAAIVRLGLLTDDELASFSDETRARVDLILSPAI